MKTLLDTHVMLAAISGQKNALTMAVKRALEEDGTRVLVSVASLWEVLIKWRLGKLPLPATPDRLPELIEAVGFEILPIVASHAVAAVKPDPPTRDPFDRLLLAQCEVEGARLLTVDRSLVAHPLAARI